MNTLLINKHVFWFSEKLAVPQVTTEEIKELTSFQKHLRKFYLIVKDLYFLKPHVCKQLQGFCKKTHCSGCC